MTWQEVVLALGGMAGILLILYLKTLDGLQTETIVIAMVIMAGLGGYPIAKTYFGGGG